MSNRSEAKIKLRVCSSNSLAFEALVFIFLFLQLLQIQPALNFISLLTTN